MIIVQCLQAKHKHIFLPYHTLLHVCLTLVCPKESVQYKNSDITLHFHYFLVKHIFCIWKPIADGQIHQPESVVQYQSLTDMSITGSFFCFQAEK